VGPKPWNDASVRLGVPQKSSRAKGGEGGELWAKTVARGQAAKGVVEG